MLTKLVTFLIEDRFVLTHVLSLCGVRTQLIAFKNIHTSANKMCQYSLIDVAFITP